MKQSFKTKLKQLWFPKAFRLPEPEFSKEQIDLLEELIQLIHPTLSKVETANRDERVHMAHFLVDLGTGIWRIRRKIEGLTRMPKEIRDALYSLESTWMSMSEGGVEIIDHIGTIPSKKEAKVVEVRDIPNLAREQVVDALKPTILLRGEVVQLGEVIMGRPVRNGVETERAASEGSVDAPPELTPPMEEEREDEDLPAETHLVETFTFEPLAAGGESEDPSPEENDVSGETADDSWPEMPIDDTAVSPEILVASMPATEEDESTAEELHALPMDQPETETTLESAGGENDAPPFDEDGEVPPQPEETIFEIIEETTGEEPAKPESEPTPELAIAEIEAEQPVVVVPEAPGADEDQASAAPDPETAEGEGDVPDVPPAPKAKRKKAATKPKGAKKTAKTEQAAEPEPKEDGDGDEVDIGEIPEARKPARPKRKRPVKTEEATEVEADG